MMKFGKVISTKIETVKGVKKRLVKFLGLGKADFQEHIEFSPAGIDSNPIKDMVAVYGPTGENGKSAVLGYINRNQLAEAGEIRLYSQNSFGAVQFYIYVKKNGTVEFNGNADNLVRYTPLNTGLQNQATAINAELTKIAAAIAAIVPGLYTPTPVQVNITQSKITEMKTTA